MSNSDLCAKRINQNLDIGYRISRIVLVNYIICFYEYSQS